jgi:hypothetical protein
MKMSEHLVKANEFKAKFMELLQEYDVGVWGTMHFRIGDQEILLDTTGNAMKGDEAEQPDVNEEE